MHLLRWENNRDTSPGCHEHQKKSGAGCLVWHLFLSEPTLLRLAASSLQPLGGGAGGSDKLYLIRDSHQPHPKGFSYTQNSSLSLGCGWWGWSWWSRNGKRCLRFPSATIPPPPQPHSNLESRDLGDRARGRVGDSEIGPRSGAEWAVPAGRADPRQRSPHPRDKCTALPDSMGSLDKGERYCSELGKRANAHSTPR